MNKEFPLSPRVVVVVLLTALTLAAYWPVRQFEFVNFDDNEYVYENPRVTTGLTLKNIAWAFTKSHSANWHPLTWISHMIDCELYGLDAGGHHLTNLLIHIVNATFLFFLMRRMTGALWRSAFVAALFALHPLHVESVAWISERKDVLSAFFLFLTIGAYFRYTQCPGFLRYAAVVLSFAAGLMVKPMLVTLPALLLIIDYWPLNRLRQRPTVEPSSPSPDFPAIKQSFVKLGMEKIPLFALAFVSGIVTILVQNSFRALSSISFDDRIANAFISYASYIVSMVFPKDLCVLYPFENIVPFIVSIVSLLFIGSVSLFVVRQKQYPWLLAGWLWYLCSLLPVIGFIQVGFQSKADRYTYLPLIGLFVIIAWGAHLFADKFPKIKAGAIILACIVIACLAVLTRYQVNYWKNDVTLYTHALLCTQNNYIVQNNLGGALIRHGRLQDAEKHLEACLRSPLQLVWNAAEYNLGEVYAKKGDFKKAIAHYIKAMRNDSAQVKVYIRLAENFKKTGDDSSSIYYLKKAIQCRPDFWEACFNLGVLMHEKDSLKTAIGYFSEVIRLNPGYWPARYYSGLSWAKKGDFQRAFIRFLEAIETCKGASMDPYFSLGVLLFKKGKLSSAKRLFSQAIGLAPLQAEPYYARAAVFYLQNNLDSAEADYVQTLRFKPDLAGAHNRLADIYAKKGLKDLALFHKNKVRADKTGDDDSVMQVNPKMLPFSTEMKK